MQYAYATCILSESGEEINEANLTAVLEAAGCSVQESRVKAIVAALEDVDVEEVTAVDVDEVGAEPSGNRAVADREDGPGVSDEPTADAGPTAESERGPVSAGQDAGETSEAGREATGGDDQLPTAFGGSSSTGRTEER